MSPINVSRDADTVRIDAAGVYYRDLNALVRKEVAAGARKITIDNVNGQRYIAGAVDKDVRFVLNGTPGQDLASFMRGPYLRVKGNAQDGVGNTMDEGKVVIEGMAGDVAGYAMRGGRIYVGSDVGYRVGIHMKAYKDKLPVIVVGGKAGDFLGEYMAGGIILLLGMNSVKPDAPITGRSLGTGMHGGVIYVRGEVPEHQLGPGLHSMAADGEDMEKIGDIVRDYAAELGRDTQEIMSRPFSKIAPFSHRPYGNMYVAC